MARLIPPMWLLEEFDIDPHDPDNERKLWKALAEKYHPAFRQKRGPGRPAKTEFDRIAGMTVKEVDLLHRIDELKQHYEENPSKFKDIYPKTLLNERSPRLQRSPAGRAINSKSCTIPAGLANPAAKIPNKAAVRGS